MATVTVAVSVAGRVRPEMDPAKADAVVAAARPTDGVPGASGLAFTRVKPMSGRYQILLKRSMFAADQRAAADREKPSPVERAQPPLEASLVVRGVFFEDERPSALIEDTATKRVFRVAAGDRIGQGRLRAISLGGVTFEADANIGSKATSMTIAVGRALDGGAGRGRRHSFVAEGTTRKESEAAARSRSVGRESIGYERRHRSPSGGRAAEVEEVKGGGRRTVMAKHIACTSR